MDRILIADWGKHTTGKSGWMYVVLSRVRRLRDLYLLEPIPGPRIGMSIDQRAKAIAIAKKNYVRRKPVIDEMQRIKTMLVAPTRDAVLTMYGGSVGNISSGNSTLR